MDKKKMVYGKTWRQEKHVIIIPPNYDKKLKEALYSGAPETRDLYQSTPSTTYAISLRLYIVNLENTVLVGRANHVTRFFCFALTRVTTGILFHKNFSSVSRLLLPSLWTREIASQDIYRWPHYSLLMSTTVKAGKLSPTSCPSFLCCDYNCLKDGQ